MASTCRCRRLGLVVAMQLPDWCVPPLWVFDAWDAVRQPRRWIDVGRWGFGALAFIVFMACGFGWMQIRSDVGLTEVRHVDALVDLPTEGPSPVLTIGPRIGGPSTTIPTSSPAEQPSGGTYLVAGVDSRAGDDSRLGAGNADDVQGARSDTVALVRVPDTGGRPEIVSLPRDSGVYRPQCAGWDFRSGRYTSAQVTAEEDTKLNSAYAVGGPRCLVSTVQQLTGIKVDKFVGIDFAGLVKIVDSVGGVDVTTDHPVVDDVLGVIVPFAGPAHLDGAEALNYARARKVEQEGRSDYGRIKRQQQLVAALVTKVKSSVLGDPGTLGELSDAFRSNVFGDNVSATDMLDDLFHLSEGRYQTAPTDGTDDAGNEVVDRNALGTMLQPIWGGDALR